MVNLKLRLKTKEWLRRYIPAEILGTAFALIAASLVFSHNHSYVLAAGAGWLGEGIGFYGYFISTELFLNNQKYRSYSFLKRVATVIGVASTNLLVEFAPAEVLDNFLIRPFAMYLVPQYIHPYPIGFLVGKFGSDLIFYMLAVVGYETRKRWLKR
jgi:hypothetical protein